MENRAIVTTSRSERKERFSGGFGPRRRFRPVSRPPQRSMPMTDSSDERRVTGCRRRQYLFVTADARVDPLVNGVDSAV